VTAPPKTAQPRDNLHFTKLLTLKKKTSQEACYQPAVGIFIILKRAGLPGSFSFYILIVF
jgi:hypothetical protein